MAKEWTEQIIFSKYHLNVCDRLLEYYAESPEKRFFIGALNELARSATHLINAILMQAHIDEGVKITTNASRNFKIFSSIAGKYIANPEVVLEIIKIKKDQVNSPVGFDRGNELLFLIDGQYKALRVDKLITLSSALKNELGELKLV